MAVKNRGKASSIPKGSANDAQTPGGISKDYEWVYTEEPHASRRKLILKAHPEVKALFGHHPASKWYALGTVVLQIALALYCSRPATPWWQFFLLGYVVSATASHSLTLAIHEMSHDLFFRKSLHNKLYSFFCNWPLVLPYASSFKGYHLEHHRKQGVDGCDVDIASDWEGRTFTTPFMKFIWVLFQPAFYAFRPLLIKPKEPTTWDVANLFSQAFFLTCMYKAGGIGSIGYLTFATWMGLGLHPCAGHFIAEHYTGIWSGSNTNTGQTPFKKDDPVMYPDETFTYRGPLNMFSYNVGIHVAHHDFPFVSGLRLAQIEKMCPEFYDHLPQSSSWPGTIYRFIFSKVNPFNRVKRRTVSGQDSKTE